MRKLVLAGVLATATLAPLPAFYSPAIVRADTKDELNAKAQASVDKALAFLKSQQQPDGSFGRGMDKYPAVTALVLRGLVQDKAHPYSNEAVQKGYKWLLAQQK